MPYFQDTDGKIHFLTNEDLADGWFARLPIGSVEVTEADADAVISASLPAPSVPSVTPWQIRKALNRMGLRVVVEATIASSNNDDLKDGWNYATEFIRTDDLVVSMGQALGKTDKEMDALFEMASQL